MSVDGVAIESVFFRPIRVLEETLEGLLRTGAPAIFPGYDYYDFRPAIRGNSGTWHPDGALLSTSDSRWWVVEVETHLHSVTEHISPQLQGLATGFYGPDAFRYLTRHPTFDADAYDVDTYEPAFLLIIDLMTAEIRDAAHRAGFETVECTPFRSVRNEYALTVSGFRPRRDISPMGTGLSLRLGEDGGMAVLGPVDGKRLPLLRDDEVVVAGTVYTVHTLGDRMGIVLPLTPDELRDLLPGGGEFRLTSAGELFTIPESTGFCP